MAGGYSVHRDIVFGRAARVAGQGEVNLLLDLYVPNAPVRAVPIIVYIHGGGWSGLDKGWCPYPMRLLEKDYAVASINYRLSQEAPFPAQLHDCKAAVRWLRAHAGDYKLDGEHIGAWGDSAGGHLAAMLGVTGNRPELEGDSGTPGISSRVQAVCDWFGPSDLAFLLQRGPAHEAHVDLDSLIAQLIGDSPADHPEKLAAASPTTYAAADAAPFLVMHGDLDDIPLSQSVLLYEALLRVDARVRLHVVHGGAHLSFMRRPTDIPWHTAEIDEIVDAFFYEHLMCVG